jgi:hypothetical protein
MLTLYFASEIRGIEGDDCPMELQQERIQRAIEKASVLRIKFPEIHWVVPHEDIFLNALHAKGYVTADQILEVELEYIVSEDCDGVVSQGEVHQGTGVHRELVAAHTVGKLSCCLDDVDEQGREFLTRKIFEYEIVRE